MAETCDICHQKPAKNHLCQIVNGEQMLLDLCDECLRAHGARTGFEIPLFDGTQRCYYCDAPARCSGMNQQCELSVRGQRFNFTCFRCAELYGQFFGEALDAIPKGLTEGEQLEAITRAIAESDRRVRERLQDIES